MLARLTILALYNYDNTLFDELNLPDGVPKESVVNAVLDKGQYFNVMYTDPDFMKDYIGAWSARHLPMFKRWAHATKLEYNPITDYSVTVHRSESTKTDIAGSNSGSSEKTDNGTEKYDTTYKNQLNGEKDITENKSGSETSTDNKSKTETVDVAGNSTTETKVSAFDTQTYQPQEMETNSNTNKTETTGSENTTNTGTSSETVTRKDTEKSSEESTTNETGETGNKTESSYSDSNTETKEEDRTSSETVTGLKGTRTYQDLVKQEIEVAMFEVAEKIADMLVTDICIMVY